jgi:hypothetical protein
MEITYKLYDIEWDTDDTDGEIHNLPSEVNVTLETDPNDLESNAVAEALCDWLSDNFGFCVWGFKFGYSKE